MFFFVLELTVGTGLTADGQTDGLTGCGLVEEGRIIT